MGGATVLVAILLSAQALIAEVIEQRQGSAMARFEVDNVDQGKARLRLSDAFTLTITVEGAYPLRFTANDSILLEDQLRTFRATGAWHGCEGETQRMRVDERERWQQTFHLDPLKPGEVKLQLNPLTWTEGPKLQPHAVKWDPIALAITTSIAPHDAKEVRGVFGPEELPPVRRWWLWWLVGLGVLVIGVGLVLGGWGLKRLLTPPVPPPLPHQWALGELKRIETSTLSAERFHTLLSSILRRYFELRFDLPATRQTTAEFLRTVHALPPEQQDRLRQFLERCDLAKFAPIETAAEECRVTAALARQLVEETAVLPESAGSEGSR